METNELTSSPRSKTKTLDAAKRKNDIDKLLDNTIERHKQTLGALDYKIIEKWCYYNLETNLSLDKIAESIKPAYSNQLAYLYSIANYYPHPSQKVVNVIDELIEHSVASNKTYLLAAIVSILKEHDIDEHSCEPSEMIKRILVKSENDETFKKMYQQTITEVAEMGECPWDKRILDAAESGWSGDMAVLFSS